MSENPSQSITAIDPQEAMMAIKQASSDTVIILDFDETLLLRNSTAEYINSLRPRLLGFIIVTLLKIVRPWVWLLPPLRGEKIRDWFLVVIPTIFLPWNLILWRKQAKELAQQQSNSELISAANRNSQGTIIVASLGFNFIINPILQHLPMRCDRLVGCSFWQGAQDRGKGKLLMMQEVLSTAALESAILVTDSEDDLPLLRIVQQPYLVIWSLAQYQHPFQDFWLSLMIQNFSKKSVDNN